jgi:integrase
MGKQKRKQFKRNPDIAKEDDSGFKAAEKFMASMTKKIFNEGPTMAGMDQKERIALLHLYATIKETGYSIIQAEAVIVASRISVKQAPTVPEVAAECVNSKRARLGVGISERYVKQLDHVLTHFSSIFPTCPIDRVLASDIETWIQSGKYSSASKRSRLTDIRTLFSFAMQREYITKNPCEKIQAIVVQRKTPGILSPRQSAKLMRVAYNRDRKLCAWLALSLFCGIREEELRRMTAKNLILEKKMVHIPAEIAKTKNSRNVTIPENAMEWIRVSGQDAFPPRNLKRRFDKLRRQAGLFKHWPNRAMRHSSVTYLYALTEDVNQVTKQHGHSAAVMMTSYHATKTSSGDIVTKEMAQEFYDIRPTPILRVLEDVA